MKTNVTRIPPNYALILIIVATMIFWLGILKVLFGHEIKEWIKSILSMMF